MTVILTVYKSRYSNYLRATWPSRPVSDNAVTGTCQTTVIYLAVINIAVVILYYNIIHRTTVVYLAVINIAVVILYYNIIHRTTVVYLTVINIAVVILYYNIIHQTTVVYLERPQGLVTPSFFHLHCLFALHHCDTPATVSCNASIRKNTYRVSAS